ncbi:hypothetical protein LCGC14_1623140, partial [marine sediment metagenome]
KGDLEGTKLAILNFCSLTDQIVVKGFIETYMKLQFD